MLLDTLTSSNRCGQSGKSGKAEMHACARYNIQFTNSSHAGAIHLPVAPPHMLNFCKVELILLTQSSPTAKFTGERSALILVG
jgi:hypothetical protein